MKVLTEPKAGKCGLIVYQQGRYGQIARTLAIPANPRTTYQMAVRNRLTLASRAWGALTQAQRDAWTATAATMQSSGTLGLHGALTGSQLYTRVYCNVAILNGTPPTTPPAIPTFAALPVTGLEITNVSNVITMSLLTTDSPADNTMLRGAPPCNPGRSKPSGYRFLGTLGSPIGNKITITNVYTARFGTPSEGQKVFVKVTQNSDGIEDNGLVFLAVVPAST
jgi:hypothetical protein